MKNFSNVSRKINLVFYNETIEFFELLLNQVKSLWNAYKNFFISNKKFSNSFESLIIKITVYLLNKNLKLFYLWFEREAFFVMVQYLISLMRQV